MYNERWHRVRREGLPYDLAVIIPAYNEEDRLPYALDDFIELIRGREEKKIQIIVVNLSLIHI